MKRIIQSAGFLSVITLLLGCRGLQSEMQKSAIHKADSTAVVANQELKLEADLTKQINTNGKGFDLVGRIKVASAASSFPEGASIHAFALRPSRTGYYVMNFNDYSGKWVWVNDLSDNPLFTGASKMENGQVVIDFVWKRLGKPDQFVACDVSVTVTDAAGERYRLSQLNVPVK